MVRLQLATETGNVIASSSTGTQKQVVSGDFFAEFLKSLMGENADLSALDMLNGMSADGEDSDSENPNALSVAAGLLSGSYGFDWLLSGGLTTDSSQLSALSSLIGSDTGSLSALSSLAGGDTGSLSALMGYSALGTGSMSSLNSLFSADSASTNGLFGSSTGSSGTEILQKLMLVQNAEALTKTDAFKSLSEADAMQVVNTMLNGNTVQANAIMENAIKTAEEATALNATATQQTAAQTLTAEQTATAKGATSGYQSETEDLSQFGLPNGTGGAEMTVETNQTEQESDFSAEMGFKNSIYQAQKLMKSQNEQSTDYATVAANSMNAASATTEVESMKVEALETVDMTDLEAQIRQNIENGGISENQSYKIKLKPEGLGEVVVKLFKAQEQMVINIVASNENAARLLNEQLPTLRQSMENTQFAVNTVLVDQQAEYSDGQRQTQQQAQGYDNADYSDYTGDSEQAEAQAYLSGLMNIYA